MGKNKRSRAYYIQSAKRQRKGSVLGPDMVGFMCTCNYHERDCVKEAYNVLNEFADTMYGKEFSDEIQKGKAANKDIDEDRSENTGNHESKNTDNSDQSKVELPSADSDSDEEPLDIEAAIKADVSTLKKNMQDEQKKARRFQQVMCGAKNCVFIQTTLEDPLPLSLAIMDDILETQKQRTKKLLRMIPVHMTCKAYPEDIERAVEKLASTYFKETSKTYCVVFKVRNNSSIRKEDIVFDLANILQNANTKNSPDLNFPEVVLNVDVIKNICCLSFLPHYFTKYSKYNLVGLANKGTTPLNEADGNKTEKGTLESNETIDEVDNGIVASKENVEETVKITAESKDDIDKIEENTVESKIVSKEIEMKADADHGEMKDEDNT